MLWSLAVGKQTYVDDIFDTYKQLEELYKQEKDRQDKEVELYQNLIHLFILEIKLDASRYGPKPRLQNIALRAEEILKRGY